MTSGCDVGVVGTWLWLLPPTTPAYSETGGGVPGGGVPGGGVPGGGVPGGGVPGGGVPGDLGSALRTE